MMIASPPLVWNEALSGIFGSVSLAAWIFLLVPQLIENYRLQSADGISLLFLSVWFIGDITNLIGAIWAGLVPTVIALAVYFCFADCILILQCVYYNYINARRARKGRTGSADSETTAVGEHEPLLQRQPSSTSVASTIGLPGSHRRRRSSASSRHDSHRRSFSQNALAQILEEDGDGRGWLRNTISVVLVCLAGTAGWAIAWRAGVWRPAYQDHSGPGQGEGDMGDLPIAVGAQVLGYASAICYLGARIPQIIKNQRERSCEGLSLLFFILSLLGNATYGAGILFHSIEKDYVLTNLPWLIGSLGTMAEDALIFVQFRTFKNKPDGDVAVSA